VLLNAVKGISDLVVVHGFINVDFADVRTVMVAVVDNGAGMTEEQLSKCPDPFYTTKEQGEGSGIGLSVAHSIVLNHNGDLMIESEPGSGTTMTMVFPKPGPKPESADDILKVSSGGNA
jgi:signal transduction histidine kinase